MKATLKLKESHHHHHHHDHHQNETQKPLLRFKIPVSILNLPFISSFTASAEDASDLSFNLRTNSPSGPSLKLSYFPTTTSAATPLSLTLKSGVGLFGSPNNSPLILAAHFNLLGTPNPSFSLQIHPQFGDFSLKKTAVSDSLSTRLPNPPKQNGGTQFHDDAHAVMPERVLFRRELTEPYAVGDGFFSGVAVRAKTVLPVGRRAAVKFRWGVNFPEDFGEGRSLPFLTVDKISFERVQEEDKVVVKQQKKSGDGEGVDLEVLKGMCVWIRREVEDLQEDNRILRESLDGLRLGSVRTNGSRSNNVTGGKRAPASTENSSEFDRWRSKKTGWEENRGREVKKSGGFEISKDEVGEELKKAIQAASINGA